MDLRRNSTDWLVLITEKQCVYSAVRAVPLSIMQVKSRLQPSSYVHLVVVYTAVEAVFQYSEDQIFFCFTKWPEGEGGNSPLPPHGVS